MRQFFCFRTVTRFAMIFVWWWHWLARQPMPPPHKNHLAAAGGAKKRASTLLCSHFKEPGSLLLPVLLVNSNLITMRKCPPDIVQTLEQSLFPELVDLKA